MEDWLAEYLPVDYGDGLATFANAKFACSLCTRRSVSAHFHLLNGVLVSWGCKSRVDFSSSCWFQELFTSDFHVFHWEIIYYTLHYF
jgi:hypothetical protein